MGRIHSATGTKHYHVFYAVHDQHQECHKHEHVAYQAHVILDYRKEASSDRSQVQLTAGGEKK
jgi:hypothetical protein